MSIAREVQVAYDLDVLAKAATDLGFIVNRNKGARGWYGVMAGAENCELVLTSKAHRFDMGFVRQADNTVKLYADEHGGHVMKDLADRLLPRYAEVMLERDRRFRITERKVVGQTIELHVGRA